VQEVDPDTGYRRYLTSQIPRAQMIKRFHELQMPLNEIRQLLASPDGSTRNTIIAAHLRRLEMTWDELGALSELRTLLGPPAGPVTISHRHIAPMLGAAIGECVDAKRSVVAGGRVGRVAFDTRYSDRRAVAPCSAVVGSRHLPWNTSVGGSISLLKASAVLAKPR
jgi:hypothetical protein